MIALGEDGGFCYSARELNSAATSRHVHGDRAYSSPGSSQRSPRPELNASGRR